MTDRPPLVAINGLFLDHPRTGTGVYTREILARLLASTGAPSSSDDTLRYAVIGHPEHAGVVAPPTPYLTQQAPLRRRAPKIEKVLWEQITLPLATARVNADLLYAPYFSLPLVTGVRTVVTIHDLIPLLLPEYAPSAPFKAYFKLVSAATRRADAIVTDSRHSAADITRCLDVSPDKIHVVPLGVDARFTHAHDAEELTRLRARLGLPERFILYLGGVDPRKNVSVLLRALKLLHDRGQKVTPLAIVAPQGGRFADPREEASRLGVASETLFLDWIADEDKAALYAAATAFVFPSHYEGFGLTPLEAMAGGTPVLCSSASSLPEVTGDAALLLDPDDADEWANALVRIDADDALRADLAARGRVRAATFTWDDTVAGLLRVFQRVVI
jgi:glycosyltransferase involved in cell wall biosynthesis